MEAKTNQGLDSKDFEDAKIQIDKILKNEKHDLGAITRCAISIRAFTGSRPAEFLAKDPVIIDALRKGANEAVRGRLSDAQLYVHLREFASVLFLIRKVKKEPREKASVLCGKLAQWLLAAEEKQWSREAVSMPPDTIFIENRVGAE